MSASNKITIGTHDGKFHADEILACVMLKSLPEYRQAEIIRTRSKDLLTQCSILVDVGGLYDPTTHRYDHHQRGFDLTFKSFFPDSSWEIKLSSAGLIYVHFGTRVLSEALGVQESDPKIPTLFKKMYALFISEIDAIDNGVPVCEGAPNYTICTGLSSRVGRFNVKWNQSQSDNYASFMQAFALVKEEFFDVLHDLSNSWYPARELVAGALKRRFELDPSGCIFSLEDSPCPWASHLHAVENEELERKSGKAFDITDKSSQIGKPIFCIYLRDDKSWSVQTVPVSELHHFQGRLHLPESWRGLRDEELDEVVGLPGCVFVHATGFLGIHKTREGVLHMARTALKAANIVAD